MLKLLKNQRLTSHPWVQALARKIYPMGETCTVRRGLLKGVKFRITPGMGFTYAWGIGVEQWHFEGLVRPGMCVYDVGANCGQSTLSLARLVGGSGLVVAFEPVETVYTNLAFNSG